MRIPVIKIRDGEIEHIVGTNHHDVLYVDSRTHGIQYLNIQGMVGTKYSEGIVFAGTDVDEYSMTGEPEIEFMEVEDFLDIAIKDMSNKVECRKKLDEYLCKKKELDDAEKDSSFTIIS